MINWRLGLDIGTNSIGWAALELTGDIGNWRTISLLDGGVRIFSDGRNPKDKQSLAVARREPRGMRRNRDRGLNRRRRFMAEMIAYALMPSDSLQRKALEKLDPWALRVRGLDEKLSLHEFGRALFHLQQRRGFKSNRKAEAGADDESGKIKTAALKTQAAMAEVDARTLAEYLAGPRLADPASVDSHPVRARLLGKGAKAFYDFYPTRDIVAAEFDQLWAVQSGFHGVGLSEAARATLRETLLFQYPLKPQPVGKCSLDPTQERAPAALATVQRLRIYQEINHLGIRLPGEAERKLSLTERDVLVTAALTKAKLTFDAARKALKLPASARFNLESDKRKHIDGDKTAAVLAAAKRWGPGWRELSLDAQDAILEILLAAEDEPALLRQLEDDHGLSSEQAALVATAPLPDGHKASCRAVSAKLLVELQRDLITYDEAVKAAGYGDHSQLDFDGEVFDRKLPFYGQVLERHVAFGSGEPNDPAEKRYGKIANPTVHVALNQIRRVVNDLIKRFGPPREIIVELARDLPLSAVGKSDLERRQRDNQAANDERRKILAGRGLADSYDNRLRLRLWEEINPKDPLDRRCPYSGEQIAISNLFSDEIEIEHILPFSQTLDDSAANKTLSVRRANRIKGQRSPYEAFHDSKDFDWHDISLRAANLPNNKTWRFGPDARQRYDNEERDFLARQLVDTRYISRLARTYLLRTGADVWVSPGRLTADLRWTWGLNNVLSDHNQTEGSDAAKNRNDHRHHAIDAIVIAMTDRSLLQAAATAAGQAEAVFDPRLLAGLPPPWAGFRDDVAKVVRNIIVSHKSDHGVQAALHNDTAYGIVSGPDKAGRSEVVHRVPLSAMTKAKDLDAIRDLIIRAKLQTGAVGLSDRQFTEALVQAGEDMEPPVRRVRIVEKLNVIAIKDQSGQIYKSYKGDGNYCYEIYADGEGCWTGEVISNFAANQTDFDPKAKQSKNSAPLIMRLRKDDMLRLGGKGSEEFYRVVKFSKGRIVLAEHTEAGSLKSRDADPDDSFRYLTGAPSRLQSLLAKAVRVSPAGRIYLMEPDA